MSPWSVIFFSRDRGEKKCVCMCVYICEKAEDGEHMSWTIYPRRSKRLHFLMKIEEKNRYAFHTSTLKAEKAHQSALISERLDLFDRVLQWMSILDVSISQRVFVFTHHMSSIRYSIFKLERFEAEEGKIGVCSVTF